MDMGNFFLVPINYLAILLCGIAAMILGYLWYGPIFGKEWSKLVGMTKEKMEKAKANMPMTYGIMFASSLVMAYVLAHFVWYAAPGSLTLFIAIKTALWAWIGFVATVSLSRFLFAVDKKPYTLLAIDAGYYLAVLIVMGAILYLVPAI